MGTETFGDVGGDCAFRELTSGQLVEWLERKVRGVGTEAEIQAHLALGLTLSRVRHEREVRLDKASRIDFMVSGSIGVEVKVGGGISPLIRQLARYAESAKVAELVLVTTRSSLCRVPEELNGKHVRVALLMGGLL